MQFLNAAKAAASQLPQAIANAKASQTYGYNPKPQELAGALRQFDPSMSFQQRRQQVYQPQPVQPQAMPQNVGMAPPQRAMQGPMPMQGGFSYR